MTDEKINFLTYKMQQVTLPGFIMSAFDYIRIIFFQLIGTAFFAYGICCSQNQPPPTYPIPADYIFVPNPAHSPFVSLALFLGICFCGQFTGGHCNPAVTLVFMMKKNSEITLSVGIIYMLSQIAGAFIGCALAWGMLEQITAPIVTPGLSVGQLFQQFGGEIFGTFFFTFFILVLTTKQTTFVTNTFTVYAMIVTMLYIARTFSFRTQGLNPALAIGMETFEAAHLHSGSVFGESWVLIIGPYIGAAIASLVFEHFYLPLLVIWKQKQAA